MCALQAFEVSLDYVGVQEAAVEHGMNNGVELARALGFDTSYFIQHNQPVKHRPGIGRRNEFIGAFGQRVDNAEPLELGHNRRAIVTRIGSLAVINTHFRASRQYADVRIAHAERLIEQTETFNDVVITLDANERSGEPARSLLEEAGYRSVFALLDRRRPATFPVKSYRSEMYGLPFGSLLPAIAIDDILVRGDIDVIDAGVLDVPDVTMKPVRGSDGSVINVPDGPSDHHGLWATLDVDIHAS